jgi:hypothetical protein
MSEPGPRIPEEQARRLWERAAQLQAEAAQREEERAGEARGEGGEEKLLPGATDEGIGYSLANVRQAGMEVGIKPEFLDLALGEDLVLELEGGSEEGQYDRAVQRILKDDRRAMEIGKDFSHPARAVWLSLETAFVSEPNHFDLLEVRAGLPEEGGVAVFEAPYISTNDGSLRYWSAAADTKRYLVRVTPRGDGGGCEALIRIPLRRSRRIAGGVELGFMTGLGILGGWGGMGIVGLLVGTGGMAALPLGVALSAGALGGAVGVGGLTRAGLNAVYRSVLRSLEGNLRKLLNRIERELDRNSALE